MFQIVLAIVVLLLVARWWSSGRRKNLPPSPGIALPIVGHVYLLPKDPMALLEKWRLKYGNMYMLKFGSQPVVLLHDFSIFQEALLKHHDVFRDRHEKFLTETILENKGIFSLNGEQWKEQRHFVHRTLRDLGMGKNIMAERMHIEIKHYLQTIADTNGEPTDFAVLINATICNVISSIVFGGRFNHTDEKFLELLSVLNFFFHKFGSSAQVRVFPFLRYLPGDFFLYHELLKRAKRMKAIIWEIINTEGRKVNVNDDSFEDFVQAYLTEIEKKKVAGITDTSIDVENMLATVWNLFNAGTETSSKTVTFGLLYLVHFQDIQEKLFQEIKENVGTDRYPNISDKPKLKYLNGFIMETIRYSKLGPFGTDRISNQDVMLRGYLIPKGTLIIPVYDSMLGNKDVWGDPENFRPERFFDEGKIEFTPFSVGKRNCVGEAMAVMELFLVFSSMIQRFQYLPEIPGQKPSLITAYGLTRQPDPFKVRAIPRQPV